MDPRFHGPFRSSNGFQSENQSMPEISSTSFLEVEDNNYHDDLDFSYEVLRYIDQMLIEEEMEDKTHMLHESLEFQAKERSFYEVLGQKHSPSPLQESALNGSSGYVIDVVDPIWLNTPTGYDDYATNDIASNSSNSSSNDLTSVLFSESQVVWNLGKGVDDSSKILPNGSKMLDINGLLVQNPKECEIKVGNNEVKNKNLHFEARGKKNHHTDENDCEGERSKKLFAVYTESNVPIEECDDVLLYTHGEREKKFEAYRAELQNVGSKNTGQSGAKGCRGKKQNRKKEVIDLRSLLIDCAQSIAADDHDTSNELLKQIRKHSSPFGDGSQRLAHYFADGLEARLAGTGSQIHKDLVYRRTIASDYLKAYYTLLASSPLCIISSFISNNFITIKSEKAMRVHVIDFGILYGFQWPTFIQRLAEREGGPPKLRITGIEFPQPGFRPAEGIEDTGRRLARYAEKFNVPFEYNAIAQIWGTIKVQDLKIEKGEFVAVNCMYRAQNLPDEEGVEESPRTMVLKLIKKINPDIFIHGIVNGSYGVPYFLTRFREALFHFSAIFDMLETTIPRGKPERTLVERDMVGREASNVIACEGWERIERPERYKQWRTRHLRAGFMQLPFDKKSMDSAMYKVRNFYHRDFFIDEDNKWLLMGWKGRVIYAISCWQPV